jgi:amino acid adenylation domain-containing protein
MNRLLQHWSIEQAQRRPEAVALVFRGDSIAYGEFDLLTNRIARTLKSAGCKPGDRVGLMVPKSIPAIAGMVGILKADAIYVPIDAASPAPRLAQIVEQCDSHIVLAGGPAQRALSEMSSKKLVSQPVRVGWMQAEAPKQAQMDIAFGWNDLDSAPSGALPSHRSSEEIAHILFTSGSTGVPKGVMIKHSNVALYINWTLKYFGTSPDDKLSGHPPLTFDLSTMDIYSTFAAGAQLHMVPPEVNLLPQKLAAFIRDSELTQWFSVPSILNHMIKYDVVTPGDFPALKRLLWCGEKFPTPSLMQWMKLLPHVTFTNLYGPTEATIASSYYQVPSCPVSEKEEIPIGVACEGEGLYVLNDELRPLPPGEIGSLYISGAGLSPGYWRDLEKTNKVFLPNPFSANPDDRIYNTGDLARMGEDGLVYLIGRADSQIKSRGYRIELGEIEAALHAMPDLKECAVVAIPTGGIEGNSICCATVPRAGHDVSPAVLRKRLSDVLPSYMVPSRWMAFDRLPLNGSGKIDKKQLREAFANAEAPSEPAQVEVAR